MKNMKTKYTLKNYTHEPFYSKSTDQTNSVRYQVGYEINQICTLSLYKRLCVCVLARIFTTKIFIWNIHRFILINSEFAIFPIRGHILRKRKFREKLTPTLPQYEILGEYLEFYYRE